MIDYNNYLTGLMADCQRSVQRPSYQSPYPHIPPQYLVRSPTSFPSITFKEPQGIAPRPCVSRDLPATAAATAAFTSSNVTPTDTASRPHAPQKLPPPIAAPRLEAPRDLPPAPHPTVNKKVPPATTAPRSAISRVLSPGATAPSPFVPLFQLPIATSISACASQKTLEPTIPTGHVGPRQDIGEGCIKEESDKGLRTHYKNMYQDAMRKELKARGLLCHGPNADLVKRLEQDDGFQAKPRTAENYDTMSPEAIHSLCVRRSIPSNGTISSLKDRLKAHDKRESSLDAATPGISPLSIPSGRFSALEVKNNKEMLEEKPLVPTVKEEPAAVTETTDPVDDLPSNVRERSLSKTDIVTRYGYDEAKQLSQRAVRQAEVEDGQLQAKRAEIFEEMAEAVTPAKPVKYIEPKTMTDRKKSCSHCRKIKRHCIHDLDGNQDLMKIIEPARAIEPAIPILTITRLRPSHPRVSASENDEKPTLAVDEITKTYDTNPRVSDPKASASENDEKPTLATPKVAPQSMTRLHLSEMAETLTPASCIKSVESRMMKGTRIIACNDCRKSKRRCIHDAKGDEDPLRAIEPAIPRPGACKAYIKDRTAPKVKKPNLATPEVAPQRMTRLRLPPPRVSVSKNDEKPRLAKDEFAGARITRSRVSDPKASASQGESASQKDPKRPARTRQIKEDVEKKDKVTKSKRTQLLYQPKDEIALLQICIKLKDVISWGRIQGFWIMVQDTLQLKTGKPYKKVSRHVEILVRKRCAEQQEIEQRGKISISRVSAGCRPLLDKWIAGGNRVHHMSPRIPTTPTLIEDKDDMSLSEEVRQQLDSDDSALAIQKRTATDAWLDTTCDTTQCKKLKLCTSEPTSGTSKSCADSIGCWSLSGSSVTSESSLEDESEDEREDKSGYGDEDDVKSGDYYSTRVKRRSAEDLVTKESNVTSLGLSTNPSPFKSSSIHHSFESNPNAA